MTNISQNRREEFEKKYSFKLAPGENSAIRKEFKRDINTLLDKELEKYKEEVVKLIAYTNHAEDCILAAYEAGRPTENGGYEEKFRGKWYQSRPVDETPKCNCGLNEIINQLIQNNKDE